MSRKKRVVIPNRCYHLVSRVAHRAFLLKTYLKPFVAQGFLALSLPDKPSSRHQKYRVTERE